MKAFSLALAAVALLALTVGAADKDKKPDYKLTADEIAKEFKEDAAAKKKYGTKPLPVIEITGNATLVIGPVNDSEILVENASRIPIRVGVKKRPAKFPAKFTATVTFKDYFDMAKELSLTASEITYK